MTAKLTLVFLFCGITVFSQDSNYAAAQERYNSQLRNQQRETAYNDMQKSAQASVYTEQKDLEAQIELNFKQKRKLNSKIDALNKEKSELQSIPDGNKTVLEIEKINKKLLKIDLELEKIYRRVKANEDEFRILHEKFTALLH